MFSRNYIKPYTIGETGKEFLKDYKKYKYRGVILDMYGPRGAHIFKYAPGWSVRNEEKYGDPFYVDVIKGKTEYLYYRPALRGAARKIAAGNGVFEPRLTNGGRQVVYLTKGQGNRQTNRKTYFLDSYDLQTSKRRRLTKLSVPYKVKREGRKYYTYNKGHPAFHVMRETPYVMYSPEKINQKGIEKQWVVYNIITGKRYEYRLPDKYMNAYFLPVSARGRSGSGIVIQKYLGYNRETRQASYVVRIIRIPDFKTVFSWKYAGSGLGARVKLLSDNQVKDVAFARLNTFWQKGDPIRCHTGARFMSGVVISANENKVTFQSGRARYRLSSGRCSSRVAP